MRLDHSIPLGLLLCGAFAATASAELVPLKHVDLSTPAKRESSRLSSESVTALMHGDTAAALAAADKAIAVNPDDPWPYYDRGIALADQGKIDDAVAALRQAEVHFGSDDAWGKSLAIWGRAYAQSEAGLCSAASSAYEEYASFVAQADPPSAEMARSYAGHCQQPAKPVAQGPSGVSHQ